MSKWPRLTGKELIKLLVKQGFLLVRTKGSHYHFKHTNGHTITVPRHSRVLSIGTLIGVVTEDLGLSQQEFIALLQKHKIK